MRLQVPQIENSPLTGPGLIAEHVDVDSNRQTGNRDPLEDEDHSTSDTDDDDEDSGDVGDLEVTRGT